MRDFFVAAICLLIRALHSEHNIVYFSIYGLPCLLQLRHIHRIHVDQVDHFFIHFKLLPQFG